MKILEEMFQFDQADLDFGIYRIMAMKREEIKKFLNEDLIAQITDDLNEILNRSGANELEGINKEIESTRASSLSETLKNAALAELEEKKKTLNSQGSISDVEGDIYSHLTNFFSRYYDDGDFISQRRYKDGAYAIPYEGEEVKLHWANADQYYIKTSEYFKDYTFKTGYGNVVHFKIVEAETDRDNNKSNEKRFFQLYTEKPFEIKDKELIIYVEYKNGGKKNQNDCITEVISEFAKVVSNYPDYNTLLTIKDGKSLLERQLVRYTARNTFDYFIHKDLSKFLNRELDFYIKNDVIFLDDIDEQNDGKTKQYLVKAKVIRKIARKIITFLAQIEDFQKKLWLKKKIVVETNYCITLDRVPKKLYNEIIVNTAQIDEWKRLFDIHEIVGDLTTIAYSEPLKKDFLEQNPFLVLDTAFFSDEFKEKLIDSIDDLDEKLDGLLIHSENFQALNLLQERYREQIDCVYIDPPYNAKSSEILYKNTYKHSSWNSFINDRVCLSYNLLTDNSIFNFTIDDYELKNSLLLLENIFKENNYIATVCVMHNPRGRNDDKFYGTAHEYMVVFSKNSNNAEIGSFDLTEKDIAAYNKTDSLSNYSLVPYTRTGNNSKRHERPNLFYSIYYNPELDKMFLDQQENCIELLPINSSGEERTWRWGKETFLKLCDTELLVKKNSEGYKVFKKRRAEGAGKKAKTMWVDSKYDASSHGIMLLRSMFGPGDIFSYPKSINTVKDALFISADENAMFLDFFAGSGTTGHAVINLNRDDDGNRKYILVEMGEYFDTVTKPRIQKVIYSEDWKDGKPVSRKGSSHAFKYIRLESYEDTLNNLHLTNGNIGLLGDVAERYMINYMLDIETKGSDSLINIDKFDKPFDYSMNITRKLESTVQNIDLVETFNYLIGLKVERSYALQTLDVDFKEGEYGAVTATIKDGSTYKIKMIEGRMLAGDSTLIIWRELTGDKIKDNAVLDAFFLRKKISTTDFEYKKIYVNGDNNLSNLRAENEGWKVLLIEEEMKKRMFENAN